MRALETSSLVRVRLAIACSGLSVADLHLFFRLSYLKPWDYWLQVAPHQACEAAIDVHAEHAEPRERDLARCFDHMRVQFERNFRQVDRNSYTIFVQLSELISQQSAAKHGPGMRRQLQLTVAQACYISTCGSGAMSNEEQGSVFIECYHGLHPFGCKRFVHSFCVPAEARVPAALANLEAGHRFTADQWKTCVKRLNVLLDKSPHRMRFLLPYSIRARPQPELPEHAPCFARHT